jgi:conjugative relaxase-like TrwC/TraI family protein
MILVIFILTVVTIHAGRGQKYYTNLVEYLSSQTAQYGQEESTSIVGQWFGLGAKRLGLNKQPIEFDDPRVASLFRGLNPSDGTPLRRGATTVRTYTNRKTGERETSKPVSAFDFTFSAPKAFSLLAGLGPTEFRERFIRLFMETVGSSLVTSLQREIGYTRTSAGGRYREKADLICAAFLHQVSRRCEGESEGDPQFHAHLLVFNGGLKANGQGGTLDSRHIKREFILRKGQEFRSELARRFSAEFQDYGLHIEPEPIKNGVSFGVRGVPKEIQQAFSKRRAEIEAALSGKENPTSKEVQAEVLRTRQDKQQKIDIDQVRHKWREIVKENGFDVDVFLQAQREHLVRQGQFEASGKRVELRREDTAWQTIPLPQDLGQARSHQEYGSSVNNIVVQAETSFNPLAARQSRQRSQRGFLDPHEEVEAAKVIKLQVRRTTTTRVEAKSLQAEYTRPQRHRQQRVPYSNVNTHDKSAVDLVRQLKSLESRKTRFQRQSLDDRIAAEIEKAQKRHQWFKVKFFFLYASGQITWKTYSKYTKGYGLPKTQLGIEWAYWSGQLKQGQRLNLRIKHGHGLPKIGVPKSKPALILARALGQISEVQHLLLLKDLQRGTNRSSHSQRKRRQTHRYS